MRAKWSKSALDQLRNRLGDLSKAAMEGRQSIHPVIGPALMPRLERPPDTAPQVHIGKPEANHNPDTWETYNLYELNTGTSIPTITSPLKTVEAWNETGQILSSSVMHMILEVMTASSNPLEKHVAFPLEMEDCDA